MVLQALAAGIAGGGDSAAGEQPGTMLCFLASYLSQSAAVLPLTPGGIGIRDIISTEIFQASGIPENTALLISLLNTVLLFMLSLLCSIFWISDPYGIKKSGKNNVTAEEQN